MAQKREKRDDPKSFVEGLRQRDSADNTLKGEFGHGEQDNLD